MNHLPSSVIVAVQAAIVERVVDDRIDPVAQFILLDGFNIIQVRRSDHSRRIVAAAQNRHSQKPEKPCAKPVLVIRDVESDS